MTLRDHIILGGAASAALYAFTELEVIWFFFASVLIDIDHYLDFVYHTGLRDVSPTNMFSYHRTLQRWWHDPAFLNMEIFHTAEFLFIVITLAMVLKSGILLALFLGLIFHIALDMIFLVRHGIFNKRTNSIISYFIKKRRLTGDGHNPEKLYKMAVKIVSSSPG
ncbi:MAG: hypothetical protein ACE5DW_03140 [Thermodesulfobacteriota bacterium]